MKKFWSKNFYQVEGGEGRREGEKERRRKGGGGGLGPRKNFWSRIENLLYRRAM